MAAPSGRRFACTALCHNSSLRFVFLSVMTYQTLAVEPLASFTEHKGLLFSIAYRMLGGVMDAEDMVQETFLKWQAADHEKINSPKAWLSTVTTRLCINHLKSAHVQRETY